MVTKQEDLEYCENLFKKNNLRFNVVKQSFSKENSSTSWLLTGKNKNHEMLIQQMMQDGRISSFQF